MHTFFTKIEIYYIKKMNITNIKAIEILDSRGNPTLRVDIELNNKIKACSEVPSGASTGIYEAYELRDNDKKRFNGKGVLNAVENVNNKIYKNINKNINYTQKELDEFLIKLDGTKNKSNLGANAILGVSMAFARAASKVKNIELYEYLGSLVNNKTYKLPQPVFNIVNGGKHSDNNLDIQEFMLIPINFKTFHDKLRAASEIFHNLKEILHKKRYTTSVGDEGGFAPDLKTNEEVFKLIVEAIKTSGYNTNDVKIGIDSASSSFYKNNLYEIKINGIPKKLNSDELINWYKDIVKKYPIILIEDGHDENDWDGFIKMEKELGDKITVVGDDLLVTNIKRIEIAIEKKCVNSVLIKLNQIGTVTETIEAIELTKKQNWKPFVSHRSGETSDTFIADLAVGLNCDLIKSGSLSRGERICKYNRLLIIENKLNSN